jgi:hypothetical protein
MTATPSAGIDPGPDSGRTNPLKPHMARLSARALSPLQSSQRPGAGASRSARRRVPGSPERPRHELYQLRRVECGHPGGDDSHRAVEVAGGAQGLPKGCADGGNTDDRVSSVYDGGSSSSADVARSVWHLVLGPAV